MVDLTPPSSTATARHHRSPHATTSPPPYGEAASTTRGKNLDDMNINKLLSDDLLIEILGRLPCKFAFQCKSVCKLWHSIISNPCFASCFVSHQVKDNYLSFHFYKKNIIIIPGHPDYNLSLDFLPCFHGGKALLGCILSSCNDLLLCSTVDSVDPMCYVCNPITKQFASIPPAPLPHNLNYSDTPVGFVCEPYYHVDNLGGGRVVMNPHCRFRIIRAFGDSSAEDSVIDMDIFSSETWEWAKVKIVRQQVYKKCPDYMSKRVISHNGQIYLQVGQNMVVYDPFNNKVFGEIDLPEDTTQGRYPFEGFSSSCGSLWMCQLNNDLHKLSVWRLKDDDDDGQGVKQQYWSLERQVLSVIAGRVIAIHPDNPHIVYLSKVSPDRGKFNFERCSIIAWNLARRAIKTVSQSEVPLNSWQPRWVCTFFLDVPVWPSPVPNIPSHGNLKVDK